MLYNVHVLRLYHCTVMTEKDCCYLQVTVYKHSTMCALKYHFFTTKIQDPCECPEIEVADLVIIDKEKPFDSDSFYGVVVNIKDNDAAIYTLSGWVYYKDKQNIQKLRINDYSTYLRDDLFVLAVKKGVLRLHSSNI